MSESEIGSLVDMLSETRPFDYNYHNRVGDGVRGLYSFWFHGCCLYVGMSIDIGRRLWEHRTRETNTDLHKYTHAFSREIEVSHVDMAGIERKVLEDIEARIIRRMDPRTNRQNR